MFCFYDEKRFDSGRERDCYVYGYVVYFVVICVVDRRSWVDGL